jgi:hypothetical protein
MKRGTKAVVFFGSMAITVASLIAIVGPHRHGYWGGHCMKGNYNHSASCQGWEQDKTMNPADQQIK